jgi:hypothetical protein
MNGVAKAREELKVGNGNKIASLKKPTALLGQPVVL